MAALHTLLRLYEPDNELAALAASPRSTARAPPTTRGPGVAGVDALPGRLSAVSGPGVRGCGRPSAVEEQNTPPLPTCATTPSPPIARLFATRGMPIVRHARHMLSPGLTLEQLAWSTAL